MPNLYKTVLKKSALKSNISWRRMEEDTNIISEPSKKATASTVNPFDPTDSMIRLPDWPTTPFDSINNNEISAIYAQMEILKEDIKKKDEKSSNCSNIY